MRNYSEDVPPWFSRFAQCGRSEWHVHMHYRQQTATCDLSPTVYVLEFFSQTAIKVTVELPEKGGLLFVERDFDQLIHHVGDFELVISGVGEPISVIGPLRESMILDDMLLFVVFRWIEGFKLIKVFPHEPAIQFLLGVMFYRKHRLRTSYGEFGTLVFDEK